MRMTMLPMQIASTTAKSGPLSFVAMARSQPGQRAPAGTACEPSRPEPGTCIGKFLLRAGSLTVIGEWIPAVKSRLPSACRWQKDNNKIGNMDTASALYDKHWRGKIQVRGGPENEMEPMSVDMDSELEG